MTRCQTCHVRCKYTENICPFYEYNCHNDHWLPSSTDPIITYKQDGILIVPSLTAGWPWKCKYMFLSWKHTAILETCKCAFASLVFPTLTLSLLFNYKLPEIHIILDRADKSLIQHQTPKFLVSWGIRGKPFLLSLFFQTLPNPRVRRQPVHPHHWVHIHGHL